MILTEEQLRELGNGEPARLRDPHTDQTYVLLRADIYEQMQAIIDRVTKRADWDDPTPRRLRAVSEKAMNRGDVLLVDWPYSDGTGSKLRPAVVVQADFLNGLIVTTSWVNHDPGPRHPQHRGHA